MDESEHHPGCNKCGRDPERHVHAADEGIAHRVEQVRRVSGGSGVDARDGAEPADLPGVEAPVRSGQRRTIAWAAARMMGVEYNAILGGRRRPAVQW
jgi:hypothetical protein